MSHPPLIPRRLREPARSVALLRAPTWGDWVETAYGNVGQNMSDNMRALIAAKGFNGPFSSRVVSRGPNRGQPFGKGLVVLVYLWECAESYDSSAPLGSQWTLITNRGDPDCSAIRAGGSTKTPDRVHFFTAAPLVFYEGLVTTQAIEGYWGGVFGDPRACQSCPLNPLANTAILVPDE